MSTVGNGSYENVTLQEVARRLDDVNANLSRRVEEVNVSLGRRIEETGHTADRSAERMEQAFIKLSEEIRRSLGGVVPKDLYQANREADGAKLNVLEEKLQQLEKRQDESATSRATFGRAVWIAIITSFLTVFTSVVITLIGSHVIK